MWTMIAMRMMLISIWQSLFLEISGHDVDNDENGNTDSNLYAKKCFRLAQTPLWKITRAGLQVCF